MLDDIIKYIKANYNNITVIIIALLICILVVLFNDYRIDERYKKQQLKSTYVEGMLQSTMVDIMATPDIAFCNKYKGNPNELNTMCGKLTDSNCKNSGCCGLVNDTKCVAGNESGPIYKTGENGQPMNLDMYYYKNKCYGPKCQ